MTFIGSIFEPLSDLGDLVKFCTGGAREMKRNFVSFVLSAYVLPVFFGPIDSLISTNTHIHKSHSKTS